MVWQALITLTFLLISPIKNAVSGDVLFYFFTERPSRDVVENALWVQENCGIKVIGVIQGVLEGERLVQAVRRLNKYQKEGFEIWIDPTLYDIFSIQAVPCFILVPADFAYSKMCVGDEEIWGKKICGNLTIRYVLEKFKVCP